MSETVLGCPFCGRKPSVGKGNTYKKDYTFLGGRTVKAGDWMWRPSIKCRICKIDREFDSVEEALAWWNKRAKVKGESR